MYGLAAGVWTQDISKALAIANNVRAGTVWVNCYHVFDAAAPFSQLLSVGNIKVQDIVHRVGFSDGSYFAAAFRKKFGVNPSFYAKHGNAAM